MSISCPLRNGGLPPWIKTACGAHHLPPSSGKFYWVWNLTPSLLYTVILSSVGIMAAVLPYILSFIPFTVFLHTRKFSNITWKFPCFHSLCSFQHRKRNVPNKICNHDYYIRSPYHVSCLSVINMGWNGNGPIFRTDILQLLHFWWEQTDCIPKTVLWRILEHWNE
jgi:hypothetical protein